MEVDPQIATLQHGWLRVVVLRRPLLFMKSNCAGRRKQRGDTNESSFTHACNALAMSLRSSMIEGLRKECRCESIRKWLKLSRKAKRDLDCAAK